MDRGTVNGVVEPTAESGDHELGCRLTAVVFRHLPSERGGIEGFERVQRYEVMTDELARRAVIDETSGFHESSVAALTRRAKA
jgi:hypothetical protein